MEKLPIQIFSHREIDELRVEGRNSSEKPKWVLTGDELNNRANSLYKDYSLFSNYFEEKENSILPFVFKAKIDDEATSKTKRKDILSLFEMDNSNNVLGITESNELLVNIKDSIEMTELGSRLQKITDYDNAISCLEKFTKFEPLVEYSPEEDVYKIKLIDYVDYETNVSIQRLFEQELEKRNIDYRKNYYTNKLIIYSVRKVSTAIIDSLSSDSEFGMIFSIEPMPRYSVTLDSLDSLQPSIPILKPDENKDYATLGILDSGISRNQYLAPWIDEDRWSVYDENSLDSKHGTFVAGVALYGDVLEGKDWIGHKGIKLFDAAVYPDTTKESVMEEDIINNIKDALDTNHDKANIWSLSISGQEQITDKVSDFAIALDNLQLKYNILICKSAGNCDNFLRNIPKGRIQHGADSVLSLVVGSMAHKKGNYDFSEVDNPSPFSRVGPGPNYIIKPEVVHYGGNAGKDNLGNITKSGVKSFDREGKICECIGTSFSTPRIASLATTIYQELGGDFNPLLIKGLLIHSASYPLNLKIPEIERTNQIGFGIPKNVNDIIYDNSYESTLILNDTLARGSYIDIMDFPMPKSLIKDGFYTGQIIVTLVYEPILDSSQLKEYCQSDIDVKLGTYSEKKKRDTSSRGILNPVGREGSKNILLDTLYSKRAMKDNSGEFALRERLLIQYEDKYYPVKKYAVDLNELSDSNKRKYLTEDKKWYLTIYGLYRAHTEREYEKKRIKPKQDFCLIITIKDPNKESLVYNGVIKELDDNNFWHKDIKLNNDVHLNA